MRAIVATIVGVLLSLSGCSRPPQAGDPQHVRSSWLPLQSQPSVRKLKRASSTKFARPVIKRAKKFKAPLAKPTRTPVESPASADVSPSLPPRKPALTPIPSPAIDAETTPPVPQRKPEETPTGPAEIINTLSRPTPSSWPPKKRRNAREFTRLRTRTFAA